MSKITRRDFINGTLMAAGATMLPIGCTNDAVINKLDPLYIRLLLLGLEGVMQDLTLMHMLELGLKNLIGVLHQS